MCRGCTSERAIIHALSCVPGGSSHWLRDRKGGIIIRMMPTLSSIPELAQSSRPLRIFVVENHADTLKWLSHYLVGTGHHVQSATTMAEALATVPQSGCDVLISDIGLPDGDGWQLLRTLCGDREPCRIYAIAMSGFGMNSDRATSKAAGFRRHLLKPFDPDELDAALEEAAREAQERG